MIDPVAASDSRPSPTLLNRHLRRVPALLCLALLGAGCSTSLPGKPDPKDRPVPAEDILAFDALYSRRCAGCHGADGTMGPAPPLNDPMFRAIVPQTELTNVLEQGRKQGPNKTAMAPFAHSGGGPLSAAQVQVLVHEIKGIPYEIVRSADGGTAKVETAANDRGIAPKWGTVKPAASSAPLYLLGKAKGDPQNGRKIFGLACASCHGTDGVGFVKEGKRRNKINDLSFLALISDQELRRIIITGRPDLGMPNYAEKTERDDDFKPLTSDEISDLVALLAAWRTGRGF